MKSIKKYLKEKERRNKKGQLDFPIITFLVIAFALFLIAPVMMKVFNTTNQKVGDSFGNVTSGGDVAKENFQVVMTKGIAWWDTVIVLAFGLALLLLLVSSFLIDTHPFWIFLYIILCFFLILFTPDIMSSLDDIYNSADAATGFKTEITQLNLVSFLRDHFGEILVGVMALTGIIIYGKVAFGGPR